MNKIILIVIIFTAFNAKAQVNLLGNFDPHSKTTSTELFPSRLGTLSGVNNEINIFSFYVGGSNTFLSYKDINDINTQVNRDSTLNVANLKDKFKKHNVAFAKIDVPLLEAVFTLFKKKQHPLTVELGSRFITEMNISISKNLSSFIADGNAQWAGQTVNLGPVQVNAMAMLQHHIGASMPFKVKVMDKEIILFPAVRLSYIKGIANVYTNKSDFNLYTEPDGRYVQANYNYNINVALPNTSPSFKDIIKTRGSGYGIDLGIGAQYGDRWTVDVSVTDIGSVHFNKDVSNYGKSGTYTYDGLITQYDYFGHYSNSTVPNKVAISPDTTHNSYATPLGAKLALMVNYHVGKVLNKKGEFKHYRHNFYLMYIQGFQTLYNSVREPNVSFGYTFALKKILDVGVVASAGGYYPKAAGAFLSMKFGIHTISIGSNNLTYFISPAATYGGDVFVRFGFAF